jgi:soluble lytic murein transglycosylase
LAELYGPALTRAEKADWRGLAKTRRVPPNPALETVLVWLSLRHSKSLAKFEDIARFLDAHPVWPERVRLLHRAEAAMNGTVKLPRRLAWFSKHRPRTTAGRLKWIKALKASGQTTEMIRAVQDTWRRATMSRKQQRRFLRENQALLNKDLHWARLDRFLWLGRSRAARGMMPLVDLDHRKLAEARIRLRRMASGVDGAIKRVPSALRADPGLVYERLRWRNRKGLKAEARELLWDVPANQTFASLWWKERSRQVRHALDVGDFEDAYLLAASHIQRDGRSFADAHWHAGWVALRYGDKAAEAAKYFAAMHDDVSTPISRARAAYWTGRALQASGSATAAVRWYTLAARHKTTFYGQLAADKLPSSIAQLPTDPILDRAVLANSTLRPLAEIARALHEADKPRFTRMFLRTLARAAPTIAGASAIAALARDLGHPDLAVYTARRAARRGIILVQAGYPVINVPNTDAPEPALTLAVIRQESSFEQTARSRVGALGLMQLMPRTARQIARALKVRYARSRLTKEPNFNLRLGASYLKRQLDAFGGSYVLALAAYNAGPHRVSRWIKERGDPRNPGVDMIDWIERIPFAETRNYVQRVLESLHVYRLRLGTPGGGSIGSWNTASAPIARSVCATDQVSGGGCDQTATADTR